MITTITMPADSDWLDGWGEIAAYLRRDVRTVQRWERLAGLPVHRHDGPRPRVWASKRELNAWWAAQEADSQRPADVQSAAVQTSPPEASSKYLLWRRWQYLGLLSAVVALISGTGLLIHELQIGSAPAFQLPDRIFAAACSESGAIRSLTVGGVPIRILLSPDGKELYEINNSAAPEILVVDPDRLLVTRRISVSGGVICMVLADAGRTLYAGTSTNGLQKIDTHTGAISVIRDGINGRVRDLLLSPDGKQLYLTLEIGGLKRLDLSTGQLTQVWADRCPSFLAGDATGRYLFVSCECGPGHYTAHDTVEVYDTVLHNTIRVLKGPPMVAGGVFVFPTGDRIWVDGMDACFNPRYRPYAPDCPFFPAEVQNVFRISDGAVVKVLAYSPRNWLGQPLFAEDGVRIIAGAHVLDTALYRDLESFPQAESVLVSPTLDRRRRRIFFAGVGSGKLFRIDLPAADCSPPALGRSHFWAGDGTLTDASGVTPLESSSPAAFARGFVGQALDLTGGAVEARTPYSVLDSTMAHEGTVEGWIKPAGAGTIVCARVGTQGVWRLDLDSDLHPILRVGRGPAMAAGSALLAGKWSHFAITYTGGHLTLRINADPWIVGGRPSLKTADTRLLQFGPGIGLLDEIAMYDRPLTDNEIRNLVRSGNNCLLHPQISR